VLVTSAKSVRVTGVGGCANCKSCGVPVPGGGDTEMKMYLLTETGMAHVKNEKT